MSQFNSTERRVAQLFARFPLIKALIKVVYSRLIYLIGKRDYVCKTSAQVLVLSEGQMESFFGYYDKSPANTSNGSCIGCITSSTTKRRPSKNAKIDLALFDKAGDVLLKLSSSSFNWQQGCRAHWLTNNLMIYNDFANERYVSHVVDLSQQRRLKSFNYPVQDSFRTQYFISLNYRRLMAIRPDYGYRNLSPLTSAELSRLEDDGLWHVDFETGKGNLLISLQDACEFAPKPEFKRAQHLFNHVLISPDGKRFCFLHRYFVRRRRFDRLLLADLASGDMRILADFGMVSHCFWADDHTILGYLRGPDNRDGYWLLDVDSAGFTRFGNDELDRYGDGHPHVYGDWFVTDTYPDKSRMQHLLLCNWKTGEVKHVGEFFHGFQYAGEARCDLHPRFSPDGKFIFFDSVFTGQRQLYRMEVPQ